MTIKGRPNKRENEICSRFRPEKKKSVINGKESKQMIKQEDQEFPPPQFSQLFCDSFAFVNDDDRNDVQKSHNRTLRSRKVKQENNRSITVVKDENSIKDEKEEYLPYVPDHVKYAMDVLMIGSNPGRMSSIKCQHFGHPSNHFYKSLHLGGFTPSLVQPKDDYTMVNQQHPLFSIGLTNLAARPSRMAQEVKREENEEGAKILTNLIRTHKPRVGVFIGIGVAKAYEHAMMMTKNVKTEKIVIDVPNDVPVVTDTELGLGVGLMTIAVRHDGGKEQLNDRPPFTLLFSSPSTSGRVTSHQLPQKADCMKRAKLLTESTLTLDSTFHQNSRSTAYKQVSIRLI